MDIKLKEVACQEIDKRSNDLNDISQKIFKNPELAYKEHAAHELLTTFLEKEGFSVLRKTPLETSFIAKYGNPGGLKIGVLCEYDALPGIGHACGHNLIAEAGIGAALGIKAAFSSKQDLNAELIVFGTPAEEAGGGKIDMIKKGLFDEADFCMMSHPCPFDVADPEMLAITEVTIIFKGKPAHAAAAPWEGINALDAAVATYNSVSMLRQQITPSARIHGIIVDGGRKPNIIPERSELTFYVRDLTNKGVSSLIEKLKNCANGAAASTGCTMEFKKNDMSYSALKTNKPLMKLYVKNAESLGVEFKADLPTDLPRGSTDMGNVSQIKPSIHPMFKVKTEGMNHTREFAKAVAEIDNQLPTLNSAKSMAMTAVDVVCKPELWTDIKMDFDEN